MDLVAISVSHQTAALHLRERLALSAEGATQLLGELVAAQGVEEAGASAALELFGLASAARDAPAVAVSPQRGRAGR